MRYILTGIFVSLTTYGICCTCGSTRSVKESYQKSEKIVAGTVLELEPVFQVDSTEFNRLRESGLTERQAMRFASEGYYEYKIGLTEPVFKGSFESDTIIVRTGLTGGACGFAFELGKKYIIYGYNKNSIPNERNDRTEQFWTDVCARTDLFSRKELKKLRRLANRD